MSIAVAKLADNSMCGILPFVRTCGAGAGKTAANSSKWAPIKFSAQFSVQIFTVVDFVGDAITAVEVAASGGGAAVQINPISASAGGDRGGGSATDGCSVDLSVRIGD